MHPIQLSGCDGCGSDDRSFFHDVRLRGVYRRLCTSCVLKSHSGLFCPLCFDLFEGSLIPTQRVVCSKCPSIAHLSCVDDDGSPSFVCPPCSDSQFVFFDNGGVRKAIDSKSAKIIVAAARIALVSMSKAAAAARAEAERRVMEAALAKKRAREALERVASLYWDKEEKDRIGAQSPVSVMAHQRKKSKGDIEATSRMNLSERFMKQLRAERKSGVSVDNGDRVKVECSSVPVMGHQDSVKVDKKKKKSSSLSQVQGRVLKGKKKKNGLFSHVSVDSSSNKNGEIGTNATRMHSWRRFVKKQLKVERKNGVCFNNGDTVNVKCSSVPVMGRQKLRDSVKVVKKKKKSSSLSQVQGHVLKGKKEKNGLLSSSHVFADSGALASSSKADVVRKGSSNTEC